MDWSTLYMAMGMESSFFSKTAVILGLLIGTACVGNSATKEELKRINELRIDCAAIRREIGQMRKGTGEVLLIDYYDKNTKLNTSLPNIWGSYAATYPGIFGSIDILTNMSDSFVRREFVASRTDPNYYNR